MRLKAMTATFAGLSARKLELGEGLNLIHSPNEGGKSTWAAFFKAMLYGIDTRDRDRRGHLADKNRYQPWSGAPMEGEVTLEWKGREITLRRGPKGNTPFGSFSAVYTGTAEPVPGLTGENCGQTLLGVEREVYERSAFIGGGSMAVTAAPELEKRIAALASSGEEDVSYGQAEGRLKEWRNRRKVNRSVGRIPELERALGEVEDTLARLEQAAGETARADGELKELDVERAELEGELDLHRRLAQRELNVRTARAKQNVETCQARLDALTAERGRFGALPPQEELRRAQGELQYLKVLDEDVKGARQALTDAEQGAEKANAALADPHFSGLTGEEARRRAEEDVQKHRQSAGRASGLKKRRRLLQTLGALVLGLVCGGSLLLSNTVWRGQPMPMAFQAAGLALLAAGAALLILSGRASSQQKKAAQEGAGVLARYGAEGPEELLALAEDYRARRQAADEAALHAKTVRGALNDRAARLENGRADLFDFVRAFAPEVRDLFGCSAALSKALGLEEKLSQAQKELLQARAHTDDLAAQGGRDFDTLEMLYPPARGQEECEAALSGVKRRMEQARRRRDVALGRMGELGDPDALSARKEELERQLERRRGEYDALTVAMEALGAANSRLSQRFSPALNRVAGEYMDRLTGGKYPAVTLNRELEGGAARQGDVLARDALYLSRGTVDQLYLAVRLAVCRLCLPEGERPPVVLDDALTAFDDGRMVLALELLEELAQEGQILLFTCQRREGEALRGRPGVKLLEL